MFVWYFLIILTFFKSYVQPKLFAKVISSASFVEAATIPHMVINDPVHAPTCLHVSRLTDASKNVNFKVL